MAAVAMRCARGLAFRATKLLTSTQTPTYYGAQTFRRFSRTVTALDSVKKFTKDHEWITLDGTTGTIGITYQAQDKLGEIVYVELPEVGAEMSQGGQWILIHSVTTFPKCRVLPTLRGGVTLEVFCPVQDASFTFHPELGPSQGCAFWPLCDECGAVESVKAVGDLFCPVSGECIEVNTALEEDASLINSSPYEDGWILKMKLSKPEELDDLMDEEAYQAFVKTEDS
ncbi:glycine cleavage system H protein-like isoform X1 [Branchiostoma lanceolatum]|uniref:glycine cleavage system H protein-like isoform X1 n=1 Tax=Branchiostoma lanceolatum TaxID=7740 RepID=UPI003457166E